MHCSTRPAGEQQPRLTQTASHRQEQFQGLTTCRETALELPIVCSRGRYNLHKRVASDRQSVAFSQSLWHFLSFKCFCCKACIILGLIYIIYIMYNSWPDGWTPWCFSHFCHSIAWWPLVINECFSSLEYSSPSSSGKQGHSELS